MGLTEKRVRDLKPGSKLVIIWDDTVKGLGARVTPAGVKSYVLSYRAGGRKRLFTLARCSEYALRDARERAARELAAIREGGDPLQRRQDAAGAPTVAELVERFLSDEAPARIKLGRLKPATVEVYEYQARAHILPAIGKWRVADVARGDVERVVAPLPGPTRNATLALLSRLFNLAERWEWRPQHSNPARGIERARQDARDRVLSPSELAALGATLNEAEARSPAAVAAIRFAALTGLRIGEVLAIQWEHLDAETGALLLPETKTGRRRHDLPTPAREVLANMPRIGSKWVFTSNGHSPASYRWVRGTFGHAAKAAGLDNVKLHDLRRTVMTSAAAAGVGTYVLRDLLGHKTATMADRYVRAVGTPVRRAREQVAGQMAAMMQGRNGGTN